MPSPQKSPEGPEFVLVGENSYKSNINTKAIFTKAITIYQALVIVQMAFYEGDPYYSSVSWDHHYRVYLGSEMEVICLSSHSRTRTPLRRGGRLP